MSKKENKKLGYFESVKIILFLPFIVPYWIGVLLWYIQGRMNQLSILIKKNVEQQEIEKKSNNENL